MEKALIGIGVTILIVFLGLIIAFDEGCPEGQSTQVIGYMPVSSGKVTTMQPMYGCGRN